jgi:hypothetical protein
MQALGAANVHAVDGDFGLGDEDGLASNGVHCGVLDVGEGERSQG